MSFLNKLNPFYWKKRALQTEQSYSIACVELERLRKDNLELQLKVDILSEDYQYPDHKKLVNDCAMAMVQPNIWRDIDTGEVLEAIPKREAKLLIDISVLKQQLEDYEKVYKALKEAKGYDIEDRIIDLTNWFESAEKSAKRFQQRYNEAQKELDFCRGRKATIEKQLAESKRLNAKWFEVAVGFGVNDFPLATQNFFSKRVAAMEIGNDKTD